MRLYLIRHPPPDIGEGICYGHSDISCTEDATAACARALLPLLPPVKTAPLYSSPLRRCLDLARMLCSTPIVDNRLMEMNFGDWELRRWDDIPRHELDAWAADPLGYAPTRGESATALRERVATLLHTLPETAVLVAHGGVLRACLAELTGAIDWHTYPFAYGTLNVIENGHLRGGLAP